MNFIEAMRETMQGKFVRLPCWADSIIVGHVNGELRFKVYGNGEPYDFAPSPNEVASKSWEICHG